MAVAVIRAAVGRSENDPLPHCLHFPTYGGCSPSGAWETRVNDGNTETEGRDGHCGRSVPCVRAGWPGAEKGAKQCWRESHGSIRLTHELTTISGCVMMGMGREQRERKPDLNELHML